LSSRGPGQPDIRGRYLVRSFSDEMGDSGINMIRVVVLLSEAKESPESIQMRKNGIERRPSEDKYSFIGFFTTFPLRNSFLSDLGL
jgi:hypothetical protein